MQISDMKHGLPIEWRRGRIVKFYGNVAAYGEKALHYEGGIHLESEGWRNGTLVVLTREHDLPHSRRRGNRFWRKGDPYTIRVSEFNDWPEFSPDEFCDGHFVAEDYVLEIRIPETSVCK